MQLKNYTREFSYNLKLGLPVMIGLFGHTFVGLMDNVMVGKLGATELAAVSLGNSFMFIAIAIGIGFSVAITPLIAESDGEKNFVHGRTIFQNGLFLCTILGLLLFLGLYASSPIFKFMQQPDEVVALAIPYFKLVAVSIIPMLIFQGYKQFADGLSETKYAMYAVIFANVINIVVNYFFIYGIWIFPALGVMGAAVGTLVSRILMVFFIYFILSRKKKFKPYFRKFRFKRIKKIYIKKIIQLGLPSAMQMFFEIAIFNVAVWFSGILGAPTQAANQIALNLGSMTFTFATGLGVTAMIRVGNQKGKRDYKELRRIAGSVFLLVILLETCFMILFITCNTLLPKIFVNMSDADKIAESLIVVGIASKLLIVSGLFQLFDGIQVVALGALRGLQDVNIPTWITLIAYWVIAFPLLYYLGLRTSLGAVGIWIGLLVGLAGSAILLVLRFHFLTKRLVENAGLSTIN